MKNMLPMLLAAGLLALTMTACKDKQTERTPDASYNPVLNPSDFVAAVTNPYLPLLPGKKYIYEGQTDEGLERVEFEITAETKTILGITATVVHDKAFLNGALIEDTYDWFAQDNTGVVWYLGEFSQEIENGQVVSTHGSWEAGADGAKPGRIMLAMPQVGDRYRQEYYFDEAEDEAEVVATGLTITVPYGTFENCIKTREWTELEPDLMEHKYYAPGVGCIKEEHIGSSEKLELIAIE